MPFIAMWKGTIEPGLSGALISQVDILASLAALTSGKIPSGRASDSQNHIKALLGQSEEGRDHLVQQGINGMKAIRKGDWKYVPPGEVRNRIKIDVNVYDKIYEPGALFYLPEDPNERTDLSSRYPKIVDDMRVLLEAELTR